MKIGETAAQVSRYTRPLDDKNFQIPRPDSMLAIFEATGGEIGPEKFYAMPPAAGPAAPSAADGAA